MKQFFALILFIAVTSISNGCKKDSETETFVEEFADVYKLTATWTFKDNSLKDNSPNGSVGWWQGFTGTDKSGTRMGFPAYSFKNRNDEYMYVGIKKDITRSYNISSWLISPVYKIKNGDKISFFTRSAEASGFADRLQVRINEVDNTAYVGTTVTSVGNFTLILKDINENLVIDGYPKTWTKYEITVSGLTAPKQSRIAFRYFPDEYKSNAIGLDLFTFTSF